MNIMVMMIYLLVLDYRCQALEFKASKSQKKIMKRVNKFLIGETQPAEIDGDTKFSKSLSSGQESEYLEEGNEQFVEVNRLPQNINIQDIALFPEESTSKTNEDIVKGMKYQNFRLNNYYDR